MSASGHCLRGGMDRHTGVWLCKAVPCYRLVLCTSDLVDIPLYTQGHFRKPATDCLE